MGTGVGAGPAMAGCVLVAKVEGRSRSSEAEEMGVKGVVVVVGCSSCCPVEGSRCTADADRSVEKLAAGGPAVVELESELAHGVARRPSSLIVDCCAKCASAAVKEAACGGLHRSFARPERDPVSLEQQTCEMDNQLYLFGLCVPVEDYC